MSETDFNINNFWKEVLLEISKGVSAVSFDIWIKTLSPMFIKGNTIVLSSPSLSSKNLVEKNYKKLISESCQKINKSVFDCEVVVGDTQSIEENINQNNNNEKPSFNNQYTFDTFVVGASNKFAAAAGKAVAEKPGTGYNPLFIYGGPGLGKTHLLNAIANQIKNLYPSKKVVLMSVESFTNELIEAIQKNKTIDFKNKYRSVDALIIDDIQFLVSKTSTQEEFFHTFNELVENGKQVVISSDKPPKELSTLADRMKSRFEMGLIADIGIPDIETRIAILAKKAQLERYNVSNEVLEYIANKFTSNVREMEGFLKRCVFYSSLTHNQNVVNMDTIKELENQVSNMKEEEPIQEKERVFDAVCSIYNLTKSELFDKKRTKYLAEARQVAMYILMDTMSLPQQYVSDIFKKDHSTVSYGVKKISIEIKKNKELKTRVEDIKNLAKGI